MAKPPACLVMSDDAGASWLWDACKVIECTESFVSVVVSMVVVVVVVVGHEDVVSSVLGL